MVMVRLHMAQTVKNAVEYIEQGHVRVGPELVLDPAFLVTRFVNCFPYFSNICFRLSPFLLHFLFYLYNF